MRVPPDSDRDEQQVLAELEELQLAIRRAHATAGWPAGLAEQPPAFDRPTARDISASSPDSAPERHVDVPHVEPALAAARRDVPPVRPAGVPAPTASGRAAADIPARPRSALRLAALAAPVLAVAVAAAWFLGRPPDPARERPVFEQQAAPAAAGDAPSPVQPGPPVQAVDPHALRIDLATRRPVWLRVIVDGTIAIEREVATGEELPFAANRTIVVRAGDAGAVTVRVGGVDQGPVGRDGQVLTRTFSAPAP